MRVAKFQPFAKFSIILLFFSCGGPLTSRISCQTRKKQISRAIPFVLFSVVHFLFKFDSATLYRVLFGEISIRIKLSWQVQLNQFGKRRERGAWPVGQ